MKLNRFGELRLIEWIRKSHSGAKAGTVDTGIGDDCAVIRSFRGKEILVTTDSLVEEVHFSLAYSPPEWIGEKAVSVNLSDIAAMGGRPDFLFLNLGFPPKIEKKIALALISGVDRACRKHGVSLLGGDTFSSPRSIFISMTVVGRMVRGKAILRKGARPSDLLFLTGTVGGSSLGFELLKRGARCDSGYWRKRREASKKDQVYARRAMNGFFRPRPHLEEGRFAAEQGWAHAMIDLSDGLSTDLHHLCHESRVGAIIHEDRIPVDPALLHFLRSKQEVLKKALSGGEDYCLLMAVPVKKGAGWQKAFEKRFSRPLYRIGEIVPADQGIHIISSAGAQKPLLPAGYEHFKKG